MKCYTMELVGKQWVIAAAIQATPGHRNQVPFVKAAGHDCLVLFETQEGTLPEGMFRYCALYANTLGPGVIIRALRENPDDDPYAMLAISPGPVVTGIGRERPFSLCVPGQTQKVWGKFCPDSGGLLVLSPGYSFDIRGGDTACRIRWTGDELEVVDERNAPCSIQNPSLEQIGAGA